MPNRFWVVGVALLLIGMGIYGLRTGVAPARFGRVARDESPALFWFLTALYFGLGAVLLGLCLPASGARPDLSPG
ncbi:MAG TPA: hypothetical protein VEY89_00520 [Candidatus Dormibacteraeota bacterium]|nr:hypothetical protein [Candidatus Dormibacteraeota bacterium]